MRYCFLRFPQGRFKALTLSYDDGCRFDIRLSKLLHSHNMKATFNINSSFFGVDSNDPHLTVDEIRQYIVGLGHEVAVHGAQHIANGNVSAVDGIRDVLECRQRLECEFGGIIRGMAYPDTGIRQMAGGVSKEQIKGYIKELGIAYSRSLAGDNDSFDLPVDFYEWIPTAHHGNPDLMNYLEKFVDAKLPDYAAIRTPKLFYLWGHSYEFENNDNWDIIENFCKTAGGREDIWYATNIEICDYINDYYSLIFNTYKTKVYNPTDREIWFEFTNNGVDFKTVSVKSGETIDI